MENDKTYKIILTLLLLLTTSMAYAYDFEVDGIYYNILNAEAKTACVTSGDIKYSEEVIIPLSVTYNIKSYSITTIGEGAFENCYELTEVTLLRKIDSIGNNAFKNCTNLTLVNTFASQAPKLGSDVFENISPKATLNYSSYSDYSEWEKFFSNSTTFLPNITEGKCGKKIYWTISKDSILNITGKGEMYNLNSPGLFYSQRKFIKELIVKEGITNIGNYAFDDCMKLIKVQFPKSLKAIGRQAFVGCTALKTVYIPDSVNEIGNSAFWGCDSLENINLPKNITIVPAGFISGTNVKNFTIPENVTAIGERAFQMCNKIKSIELPSNITTIRLYAFQGCSGLTSITIPEKITTLEEGVFKGCKNLTVVNLNNNLTNICHYAFKDCTGLTNITIPKNVKLFGAYAFQNCTSLKQITSNIPADSLKLINEYVFNGVDKNNCTLYVPAGAKATYAATDGWKEFTNIVEMEEEKNFCGDSVYWKFDEATGTLIISGTGAMADYDDDNRVPWSDVYESIKKVIIEEGITSIGKWAFLNCYGITSVTIPNSVTAIGEAAFAHCYSLTSVTIPNSVTTIKEDAFYSCKGITSIVVNEGNSVYDSRDNCNAIIKTSTNELIQGCKNTTIPNSVTTIGNKAFNFCDGLTNITIPNSVTSIGEYAFSLCDGLTSITFPNSVTTIGQAAFAQCEGLTSVTIPSSVTSIGFQAFDNCNNIVNITSYIPIDGLFPISVHTFGDVDKNNCTLYVPAGSKATYATTDGWNEFTNIVEINPEISISVDSISTPPGRSITLPVGMANSEAVTAFQIDLELPEGIEFVSATLSDERKTTTHYLNTSVLATGKRRIIAYSTNNSPFKLNEGTLLNINLNVAKEIENGDYKVNISNIRMVMPNSNEILLDPISANITVKEVKGDANNDFDVTMGDVVAVANYILELLFGAFNFDAADINGDGEITMGDLVAIINIILYPEDYDYGRNAKRGVMAANGNEISLPDTRSTEEAVSIPVSLNNTMAYTAFQMDIELPEGAKLASATASERAAAHSVAWSCLPDGKMRVVAYSLDNEVFSDNAGELVALNIEAEGAVSGAISVENVRMVTPSGDEYAIGNCGSLLDINGTTGIGAVEGNSLKVYTADGALIVESGKAMKVAVYSVNGKLVKTIEVAEGKNVFDGIPAGTYVVAGVKVAIK